MKRDLDLIRQIMLTLEEKIHIKKVWILRI